MKKISKMLKEGSALGNMGSPPDSGPNTFVSVRKHKQINDLFAEKLGFKVMKLFADSDMLSIRNGDRMGNKLNIDDKKDDYNEFNRNIAKALGFKIIKLLDNDKI